MLDPNFDSTQEVAFTQLGDFPDWLYQAMLRLARKVLSIDGLHSEAIDAVHSVLCRAMERPEQAKWPLQFILAIKRECISRLRHNQVLKYKSISIDDLFYIGHEGWGADDGLPQTSDSMKSSDRLALTDSTFALGIHNRIALDEAMKSLPTRHAQVVLLYYKAGFTIEEIATLVKLKAAYIKLVLHEARNKLRTMLGGD